MLAREAKTKRSSDPSTYQAASAGPSAAWRSGPRLKPAGLLRAKGEGFGFGKGLGLSLWEGCDSWKGSGAQGLRPYGLVVLRVWGSLGL